MEGVITNQNHEPKGSLKLDHICSSASSTAVSLFLGQISTPASTSRPASHRCAKHSRSSFLAAEPAARAPVISSAITDSSPHISTARASGMRKLTTWLHYVVFCHIWVSEELCYNWIPDTAQAYLVYANVFDISNNISTVQLVAFLFPCPSTLARHCLHLAYHIHLTSYILVPIKHSTVSCTTHMHADLKLS